MQALRLVLGLLFISVINALVANSRSAFASSRIFQLKAKVQVGTTAEIPNGERKIVDTNAGAVIITNVNGGFYAVNAKCPHLGERRIHTIPRQLMDIFHLTFSSRDNNIL